MTNLPRAPGQPLETAANTGYSAAPAWGRRESPDGAGWGRGPLGSRRGRGPPSRRWVAGLRGRTATLGLRYGPDSYGRQQWGILGNGRKPDPATPREGRRLSGCKLLLPGTKNVTVPGEKATANYVPAAAVIRRWQALSGFIGRKGNAGGLLSLM